VAGGQLAGHHNVGFVWPFYTFHIAHFGEKALSIFFGRYGSVINGS
jgi:hypothetical protein